MSESARLKKEDGPYKRGQKVTTDPAAPWESAGLAKPVFVDPARFEQWRLDGYFTADKVAGETGETEGEG